MAVTRNGNTIYIDATGDIPDTLGAAALYIVVTATAANAVVVFRDQHVSTPPVKLDLRVAAAGSTQIFPFESAPVVFPTGINVGTLTNAYVTIIYRRQGVAGGA